MRESAKWKLAEVFKKRVQESGKRKSAESPQKSIMIVARAGGVGGACL